MCNLLMKFTLMMHIVTVRQVYKGKVHPVTSQEGPRGGGGSRGIALLFLQPHS
jgi:hypothetical protein